MQEAGYARLFPEMLDVRDPTVYKNKIEPPFPDHLIGDVHIAISGILSFRDMHLRPRPAVPEGNLCSGNRNNPRNRASLRARTDVRLASRGDSVCLSTSAPRAKGCVANASAPASRGRPEAR